VNAPDGVETGRDGLAIDRYQNIACPRSGQLTRRPWRDLECNHAFRAIAPENPVLHFLRARPEDDVRDTEDNQDNDNAQDMGGPTPGNARCACRGVPRTGS
jgi:hypothetical protein